MQPATELDLPFLDMSDDGFAADPYPHFDAARARHPWLARWALGYVITDYMATRELFRSEDRLGMLYDNIVDIMEARDTPWGNFQSRHISSNSGPRHRQLRDLLAPAFSPRQVNQHRALMREVMTGLLDEWAPKGAFDFEEFASYFPITVMCRLIGADPSVIPGLRSAMEAIGLSTSMDRRWLPAMQEGVVTMERFVADLVADRRADPCRGNDPDLLDVLILSADKGEISGQELADLLIFLFVAGYDTSKNMLTLTMAELVKRPDLYRRCGEDHAFARDAVEESFRLHSTTSIARQLTEDIAFRDTVLEKGAIVWFPLSVATHDQRYAAAPDAYDPDARRKHPQIGFGLGRHICLGQYVARAQIHEGLHLIARRLRNPQSPGPGGWRPFPGAWGIRSLPVSFDAEVVPS